MRPFEDTQCLLCPDVGLCRQNITHEEYEVFVQTIPEQYDKMVNCRIVKFIRHLTNRRE